MIRGLIVGKFCPPHAGHRFLIETALAQVDHLDVLVCSHLSHTIPGELRGQWLREIHPRACVKVIDDPGHDDDSQFWAEYTIRLLGRVPDIVFSSEDYGEPYARLMKCRHIMVDRERMRVPISGRMIRSAPFEHWKYLDPCVRAYYLRRIRVVGAESTGKTTLARALAEHYDTAWVPEYAREYCERLQRSGLSTVLQLEGVVIGPREIATQQEIAGEIGIRLVLGLLPQQRSAVLPDIGGGHDLMAEGLLRGQVPLPGAR